MAREKTLTNAEYLALERDLLRAKDHYWAVWDKRPPDNDTEAMKAWEAERTRAHLDYMSLLVKKEDEIERRRRNCFGGAK